MSSGDGAKPSGRRRDSGLARFAARIQELVERWIMTALMIGELSVREVMDRRCVSFSLAFCHCESQSECPEHPLSAAMLPSEVLALGGRGNWDGVGGSITVFYEVAGTLAWGSTWGGDGGGTVAGSAVDAEMSTAEVRMDVGGELPPSDVIIQGWGAWSRPEAAGASVTGWLPYLSTVMYRCCLGAVQLVGWSWQETTCWRKER